MINFLYSLIDYILPFSFTNHIFMKNALIAVLLISPLFGLVGTMIVNKKMVFFADSLGHSALTGIGLGVVLGFSNHLLAIILFSIIFSILIVLIKNKNNNSTDTTIGVFSSFSIALGLFLLSKAGGFKKYSYYLIGDILNISQRDILNLFIVFILIVIFWSLFFNKFFAVSINKELANSKGLSHSLLEMIFVSAISIIVAVSIQWVGILVINSLLVLPAATARNFCKNMKSYTFYSVAISLFSGLFGLVLSYYLGTASGATIILILSALYFLTLFIKIKG